MHKLDKLLIVLTWVVFVPTAAYAQASITGVVRDTSGGVLPGVTVEAASPALIERVRSVVTDGTGQYRVVDLPPGTYTVTFTLRGFATVRREGVELTGTFTAVVNAIQRVGGVEETVTVTGEAPIVDVQTATRQRVMDREAIDTLPTGRLIQNLGNLIPGVYAVTGDALTLRADVGGSAGEGIAELRIHGSDAASQRQMVSGLNLGTHTRSGSIGNVAPSMGSVVEVAIDTSAVSAEQGQGGVRVNFIPRDGGNKFSSVVFFTGANSDMQSSNFTQELEDRGLSSPNRLKSVVEFNPAFGGPIKRDRLWFWTAYRYNRVKNTVAGMFRNLNAGDPTKWTFERDLSRPAVDEGFWRNASLRLTWQATPKNKFAVFYDDQDRCGCPSPSATVAPEAGGDFLSRPMRPTTVEWVSPLTNRLLLEAKAFSRVYFHSTSAVPRGVDPTLIEVQDQKDGITYRGRANYNRGRTANYIVSFSASYVTGAHAFKVGFSDGWGSVWINNFGFTTSAYRFRDGVPNQITLNSNPRPSTTMNMKADIGLYAQDKWTIDRLTLNLGVRYDYLNNYAPETTVGPAPLTPNRNITFPRTPGVAWSDITPKLAAAYDLFGNGRSAVKASLNKYVRGQSLDGTFGFNLAPAGLLVTSTTRSWDDRNRDFVPNCDLANPLKNGECGAMRNSNFGKTVAGGTQDPDILRGWGKRQYDWEFSAGVQHAILPRVSVDLAYVRRWFGNFNVTDNRTLGPADYDRFSITAPVDPRLPGGGGFVVTDLYDVKPDKFGLPADDFLTFAKNFGNQYSNWNGVDVTVNARLENGLNIQGGVSTGKTATDNCEVVAKVDNPSTRFCHVETPFLTQVKLTGMYVIPRMDVQIAGTFQSVPGNDLEANFQATNVLVAPSLGRNLAGGAANVTVNLVEPGTLYTDRLNQFDFRVGKIFRAAGTRSVLNLDLYNAFNSNTVLVENQNFGSWRVPQSILPGRLVKVSVQFDF